MLIMRQSTVQIRIPAGLTIRMKATERNEHGGFNAIPDHDGRLSRRTARRFGPQLLPGDSRFFVGGIGKPPREARARTLALVPGRVSLAARALTVEFVCVRPYAGFFLSTLVIYPTSVERAVAPPVPSDESAL